MFPEMVQRKYANSRQEQDLPDEKKTLTKQEYLRGNTETNDCQKIFVKYQTCLNV